MVRWLVGWLVGWLAELSFFLRFIAKKVCTAYSKSNNKIVPITNLNKCVYNEKSETEGNIKNNSEKKNCLKYTSTMGVLYSMYKGVRSARV